MIRFVGAHLALTVDAPARLAFQVAVAESAGHALTETAAITHDGVGVHYEEVSAPHGGRIWLVDVAAGEVVLDYTARVEGTSGPHVADDADLLLYLRPSRYCESDRLAGFARREFAGIADPAAMVAAVGDWVRARLDYVSGSSDVTDGAVDTLIGGRGVCRDFAHLSVALLRALEVPARVVAVYAPGLYPMDFHAVAEACVDGVWYVIDPTRLAPRQALVRLATGRDATDTAFLSNYGGNLTLHRVWVTAWVDGDFPVDDVALSVTLG